METKVEIKGILYTFWNNGVYVGKVAQRLGSGNRPTGTWGYEAAEEVGTRAYWYRRLDSAQKATNALMKKIGYRKSTG